MIEVIETPQVIDRIRSGEMFRRKGWHNGKVAIYAKETSGFFEPMIMTLTKNFILEHPLFFNRADWFADDWIPVSSLPGIPGQEINKEPPKESKVRSTPKPPTKKATTKRKTATKTKAKGKANAKPK